MCCSDLALKLRQFANTCASYSLCCFSCITAKDAGRKAERESDNLGSKAKSAIDDAASSAKSALRDAKGSGKDLADDAERNVRNAADDVESNADGIGSKIKHAAGDVKDAVGDAANAIKHKGESLLNDRSLLSTVFKGFHCALLARLATRLTACHHH